MQATARQSGYDEGAMGRSSFSRERRALVRDIERQTAGLPYPLCDRPLSAAVLDAMAAVPREAFMPAQQREFAYVNAPSPIGHGQTISQPFIVALMTDLLGARPEHTVLEVGTGSGYQAAVLSLLVAHVYSVEIVEPLALAARDRLQAMRYDNVHVRSGDGGGGWPGHAPYDGVIVTAASEDVPPALVSQMREGARMVIPIGRAHDVQWLTTVDKQRGGELFVRQLLAVRFVPMTSGPAPDARGASHESGPRGKRAP